MLILELLQCPPFPEAWHRCLLLQTFNILDDSNKIATRNNKQYRRVSKVFKNGCEVYIIDRLSLGIVARVAVYQNALSSSYSGRSLKT